MVEQRPPKPQVAGSNPASLARPLTLVRGAFTIMQLYILVLMGLHAEMHVENLANCWKALRAYMLKRKDEICLNAQCLKSYRIGQSAAKS